MKRIPPLPSTFTLLGLWALAAWPAWGFQPETETVLNTDPDWFAEFGTAVAISGDRALVGAPGSYAGESWGAAFVFVKGPDGWAPEVTLATDIASARRFGQSVALDGDTAVIGDPAHTADGIQSGAVHVFVREAGRWTLQATLRPGDRAANQRFGCAVAVSGDRVAVGALADTGAYPSSGAVYVFDRGGGEWHQTAKIKADPEFGGDGLGTSVALTGNTLVAGAPGHDLPSLSDAGAVYVFRFSGLDWVQECILTAAEQSSKNALLGASVALAEHRVLAGAPAGDDPSAEVHGAAYLFARDTDRQWLKLARLTAQDAAPFDKFGSAVALWGRSAAVGAPQSGAFERLAGAVTLFAETARGWQETVTLGANDPVSQAFYGSALALAGSRLAVGAPWWDAPTEDWPMMQAGQGYLYESSEDPPPPNAPPIADASATVAEVLSANGTDAIVTLDGSNSSDPDGDPLSFTWTVDGVEIAAGMVAEVVLGIGVHEIVLTVSDGQDQAVASVTVAVFPAANQPPVADASATQTRVISPNNRNARVRLDGSASSDPEGDPLEFVWLLGGQPLGVGAKCEVTLPVGLHRLTLVVDDGQAASETSSALEIITAGQATREVRALLQDRTLPNPRKKAALVLLENAARFFDRGRMMQGVHFLKLSRKMLELPGRSRMKSNRTDDLTAAIQQIIDAVTAG